MKQPNRMNTNKVSINIEVETYFANYEKLKGVKLSNSGISKRFYQQIFKTALYKHTQY